MGKYLFIAITLIFSSPVISNPLGLKLSFKQIYDFPPGGSPLGILNDPNKLNSTAINIGLLLPISENPSNAAEAIIAAWSATYEINRKGGVDGIPMQLIVADSAGKTDEAIKVTQTLIRDHKVVAIIGPQTTTSTRAIAKKVLSKTPLPVLTPSATGDDLYKQSANNSIWRLPRTNMHQAHGIFQFTKRLNSNRAGVIVLDSVYGSEIADLIGKTFKDNGFKLKDRLHFKENKIRSNSPISKEEAERIRKLDFIIIAGSESLYKHFYPSLSQIVKNSDVKNIVGTDAIYGEYLRKQLSADNVNCQYFTLPYATQDAFGFIRKILAKYKIKMVSYDSPFIYDSVYILGYAIRYQNKYGGKLGHAINQIASLNESTDIPTLHSARNNGINQIQLGKLNNFEGISGAIGFNEEQDNVLARFGFWSLKGRTLVNYKFQKANTCN